MPYLIEISLTEGLAYEREGLSRIDDHHTRMGSHIALLEDNYDMWTKRGFRAHCQTSYEPAGSHPITSPKPC